MKSPLLASIASTTVSAVYWYVVGQFLSIIPPMMLDDGSFLLRVTAELAVAVVIYILAALAFFSWLLRHPRNA